MFTIDASVWISAFTPSEVGHGQSFDFLNRVRAKNVSVVIPTLALVEVAASIVRSGRDSNLAKSFVAEIERLSFVDVVNLDHDLATRAVDVAVHRLLRGADAVYAAVAESSKPC